MQPGRRDGGQPCEVQLFPVLWCDRGRSDITAADVLREIAALRALIEPGDPVALRDSYAQHYNCGLIG